MSIKTDYEEINLHGYKIHIYENKVKVYNHNKLEKFDFKSICDRLVNYLMDEAFMPRKHVKVEMVTLNEVKNEPSSSIDSQNS
jgi:hypothetical protein